MSNPFRFVIVGCFCCLLMGACKFFPSHSHHTKPSSSLLCPHSRVFADTFGQMDWKTIPVGIYIEDTSSAIIHCTLFGNYNDSTQTSIHSGEIIPDGDNRFGNLWGGAYQLSANIVFKQKIHSSKGDYLLVVLGSSQGEQHNCSPCGQMMSVARWLKIKDLGWQLMDYEFIGDIGHAGYPPDSIFLSEIGKERLGLSFTVDRVGTGYHSIYCWMFSVEKGYPLVFDYNTYGKNWNCDEEENPDKCVSDSTTLTFIPHKEQSFHKIQTHKVGTKWDYEKGKVFPIDSQKVFTFQNGKYREQ